MHSVCVHDNLRQFCSFWWVNQQLSIYPGYVKTSGGIRTNADAEGPLVTIDLINSANWTGNWSQLCPTFKVLLESFLYLFSLQLASLP
ncbi:putative protein S-acyltransferase [Helianthus anomalus]